MTTGTLPSPAPERHLPPPEDPWGAVFEDAPVGEDGRIHLSDDEVRARYDAIMSQYADPELAQQEEPIARNIPDAHREHVPTLTPEQIARREQAGLIATYALANTLRDSNPELLAEFVPATRNTDTVTLPAARPDNYRGRRRESDRRPANYQGRHRR